MNVCAVIVTYNNRFKLLIQVIESLIRLKINKIIVVDNNSSDISRDQLITLEKKLLGKLKVLYLPENTGSAGGYSKGLTEFHNDNSSEFVWLLDDDNVPEESSLEVLKEFWKKLEINDKEKITALLSYRKDREVYKKAVINDKPDLVIGQRNGFMGFNIITIISRIINNVFMPKKERKKHLFIDPKFGEVSAAYYGGLFFHKNLLDKISYPNSKFFVYADDTEFSSRINKLGGKIYIVFDSRINDIDEKWKIEKGEESFLKLPSIDELHKDRLYYKIRNRIYFEKHYWASNHFVFQINKIIYLIILKFLLLINKKITNKEIIKIAINDGLKGKMGKREGIICK